MTKLLAENEIEEKRKICPHCKSGSIERPTKTYFSCSRCKSIYRYSASKGWERLNVDPVTDTSAYPEVTLVANPPYCDCELKEYVETLFRRYGPEYCSKHNVIAVGGIYDMKNPPGNIDEITQYTLMHETLHWVLGKFVDKKASYWLDNESVTRFIDQYYFEDKPEIAHKN